METTKELLEDKICRLCIRDVPMRTVNLTQEIRQKLEFCTKMQYIEDALLPKSLCTECLHLLSTCYDFINKCRTNEEILVNKLKKPAEYDIKIELKDEKVVLPIVDIKVEDSDSPLDMYVEDLLRTDDLELVVKNEPKVKIKKKSSKKHKRKLLSKKHDSATKRSYKKRVKKELQLWYCSVCGQKCFSPSALAIHMNVHSDQKPFECEVCLKCYKSKYTLTMHKKNNHSPVKIVKRKLECEHCPKQFNRKTNLIVHLRTHTGERPYPCSYCTLSFTQWSSLLRHKRIHTDERPYLCKSCGKTFKDSATLKIHQSTHSEERNFICGTCGLAVKTKRTLRAHLLLHTENSKKYMCDFCAKTFRTKGNLVLHRNKSHSEKSGICKICKKLCSDVVKHEIEHLGLFKCTTCNKTFNRAANLKTHIKHSHTEKAKFKCDLCNGGFATKSKLRFHIMKLHTNETPFKCKVCGRGFIRFCDLSKHMRVYHKYDSEKIAVDCKDALELRRDFMKMDSFLTEEKIKMLTAVN